MTSVLLAEDDTSISEPLARALRREGYTVEVSPDGPQALERALGGGVDLIVLDLGLPELDGLEVARRVGAEGPGASILILTGCAASSATMPAASATSPRCGASASGLNAAISPGRLGQVALSREIRESAI